MIKVINIITCLFVLMISVHAQHPRLSLTPDGVDRIRGGAGSVPLFDKRLAEVQHQVDQVLDHGDISVPIPRDMAGGYTHEQHKSNYKIMHLAGNLYQITDEEKYAAFIRDMLLEYAKMYPTLPLHPTNRSYATGKIFWQCLNDANWLVFTSQAYDCIYDFLSASERAMLESQLFIPFADFLSIENPRFFNRIHNHSTWANAAVGMIALVMDNDSLLSKALYGLENDGIGAHEFDNDGGFIKKEGVTTAGFLAQLDHSFSPDGYFAEGPYYQRYAIFPFLKFSQALYHNIPELDIFNYRDGILKKATQALLQLTDKQGNFYPINDAQKGMSFHTFEVVMAVDLMYFVDQSQTGLLNWAAAQGQVTLDEAGFVTAMALTDWKVNPPEKTSVVYGDGITGTEGGVAILRTEDLEVLFKYSSQGMGHGHFDRLSYTLNSRQGDIVQDYGAVRWVNVDQKAGGRYLPENNSFGKQTVGHNTTVINQTSHYEASVKLAEQAHPSLYHADVGEQNVQMVSAREEQAYDDVNLHRTLFLITDDDLTGPVFLDIMQINSHETVSIDMPLWFVGHHMQSSFNCPKTTDALSTLGTDNGYQHIWQEAACTAGNDNIHFNWFGNEQFYTLHSASNPNDSILMGRLGANDPNYNLRPDPVLIHRRTDVTQSTFVNLIESHGAYSRVTEIPNSPYAQIKNLELIYQDESYVIVSFATTQQEWELKLSLQNSDTTRKHVVDHGGDKYEWQGIYDFKKLIK